MRRIPTLIGAGLVAAATASAIAVGVGSAQAPGGADAHLRGADGPRRRRLHRRPAPEQDDPREQGRRVPLPERRPRPGSAPRWASTRPAAAPARHAAWHRHRLICDGVYTLQDGRSSAFADVHLHGAPEDHLRGDRGERRLRGGPGERDAHVPARQEQPVGGHDHPPAAVGQRARPCAAPRARTGGDCPAGGRGNSLRRGSPPTARARGRGPAQDGSHSRGARRLRVRPAAARAHDRRLPDRGARGRRRHGDRVPRRRRRAGPAGRAQGDRPRARAGRALPRALQVRVATGRRRWSTPTSSPSTAAARRTGASTSRCASSRAPACRS